MARARVIVDRTIAGSGNLWNAAGVSASASSAVSALPAAASQNPDRNYVWRSVTGTGAPYLRVDLGSAQPFNCLAVANIKTVGSGVAKVQELGSGGSPGAATDLATLPAQDASRKLAFVFFGSVTKRHVQIAFTNPGSANDYAEVGYVALGTYFEPGSNFTVPAKFPYADRSEARMSDGGQKSFRHRDPYFGGSCLFDALLEADFDALHAIYQLLGVGVPFFFLLDIARPWMNYLARFTTFEPEHDLAPGRITLTCGFEEAL